VNCIKTETRIDVRTKTYVTLPDAGGLEGRLLRTWFVVGIEVKVEVLVDVVTREM